MDTLDEFLMTRPPTSMRPLLGLTVLIVEDSRFASEAMRLLCLRSGARIRRADSLFSARRHLKVYRPGAILVDLGLPDGSGAELIAELARATPRIDVVLGMSGDPGAEAAARAAGADGFIAKPIARLAAFQAAILDQLPHSRQPPGPRILTEDRIFPDQIAYRDDLAQVAAIIDGESEGNVIDYLTQFLRGVAHSAGDDDMTAAVGALADARQSGRPVRPDIARVAALVQSRLSAAGPI
jgi:two-component system, OmpR family, response regulator